MDILKILAKKKHEHIKSKVNFTFIFSKAHTFNYLYRF
jgi:hypothetical protein